MTADSRLWRFKTATSETTFKQFRTHNTSTQTQSTNHTNPHTHTHIQSAYTNTPHQNVQTSPVCNLPILNVFRLYQGDQNQDTCLTCISIYIYTYIYIYIDIYMLQVPCKCERLQNVQPARMAAAACLSGQFRGAGT